MARINLAGQRGARRADDQPGDRVHPRGTGRPWADRVAAHRGEHPGGAAAAGLRPVLGAVYGSAEMGVPGEPQRSQRGAVLPAADRAHLRDAARGVYADRGIGDRKIQPRIPPHPRHLPVRGSPRRGRNRAPKHRPRSGRRRPAGGHRLRGHPGHRRPRGGRHRDLHRQARRVHRGRRHTPTAGATRGIGHGHRQSETSQRRHVPGCQARQGPRPTVRRPDRRLRHRREQTVPDRDAALGGLRCHQRPPHPDPVRRPGLYLQ